MPSRESDVAAAAMDGASQTGPSQNGQPGLLRTYDFIIVGGGTSGLVLADRLSESGKHSVLVLEAGGDPSEASMWRVPGELGHLQGTQLDWNFLSAPQPLLGGRQIPYRRGRGLGGSSNVNGLFYGRGSAEVYDQWERLGNPGWSWKDVYPEFVKSTHFNPPMKDGFNKAFQTYEPSAYGKGPLQVGHQGYVVASGPAFIEACQTVDIPIVKDLNSGDGIGVKQGTVAVDGQYRRSSGYSYYERSRGRSNLRVMHHTPVQSLLFSQGQGNVKPRVTGVVFMDNPSGVFRSISAKNEVIVTMGAVQTPQLLMVSGIGPRDTLESRGIKPRVVNENVGQNFMDHSFFSIMAQTVPEGSMHKHILNLTDIQANESDYYSKGAGIYTGVAGATNAFQAYSDEKLRSLDASGVVATDYTKRATMEILFNAMFFPPVPTQSHNPSPEGSYFSLTVSSLVSLSRGNVSIASASMADSPIINPNYYSHPADRSIAINGFRDARKILASQALAPFVVGPNHGEVSPGKMVDSEDDNAIFEYIKAGTMSNLHASGTCAMLPHDKKGVVDPKLRVFGVDGLRVADGSIMPILPDTHTSGPIYMIGERMASFLKDEYGN